MSINDSRQKISVKMTLFQYFQAVNFGLFLRITQKLWGWSRRNCKNNV